MEDDGFKNELLELRKEIERMHKKNPPKIPMIITDREMHHRKVWGMDTTNFISLNDWYESKKKRVR